MDFMLPNHLSKELETFKAFLQEHLVPHLADWYQQGSVPRSFLRALGERSWLGFDLTSDQPVKHSSFKGCLLTEQLSTLSPGVAVAILALIELGLNGLWVFGSV